MSGFPLAVDLRNRLVVVVGAGGAATRRVRAISARRRAAIHVVAPNASDEIRELAAVKAPSRGVIATSTTRILPEPGWWLRRRMTSQ